MPQQITRLAAIMLFLLGPLLAMASSSSADTHVLASDPADIDQAHSSRPNSLQSLDLNIHNYNLCGASCASGNNPPYDASNAIDLAKFVFIADDAEALTLQEVCLAQMDDLVDGIAGSWSWVFVASRQVTPNCDADTEGRSWYGNAILHRGYFAEYDGWELSNPGRDCEADTVECRTMICAHVDSSWSGMSYGNCSTHLINNDVGTAQMQANEYLFISTLYLGSGLRWLGADFNLLPSEVPDGYGSWRQLVLGDTIPAPTPNRQFDYIWARGANGYGLRSIDCSVQVEHSDHCYTAGSVWWNA